MSFLQRLIFLFVTRRCAESMEAESRAWKLRCASCGDEVSIWELGGIRWKAYSRGKRIYRRCQKCGTKSWQEMYYDERDAR